MKIVGIKRAQQKETMALPGFMSWSNEKYPFLPEEILPNELGVCGDDRFVIVDGAMNSAKEERMTTLKAGTPDEKDIAGLYEPSFKIIP